MTTITSWHINWGDGGSSDVTIPTGSSPLVSTPPHTYAVASVLGYAVAITATGKNAGGSTVQLDMPHLELPLATAPFLPDAIYQGPVPEPAYFSEFDTFAPPVRAGSSGASGTPSIDEFTRSAGPNQSIAVTAESLTTQASPSANDDTSFLTYGQTTVADGVLAPARIQTIDDQKTSLTLPASLTPGSIYLLWPHNSLGYGNPVVVNQPELWWADTSTAYSGQRMS
ncbi:MAG TPA: hypothetical protein VLI90_00400, partial [Tepidisphaeraceae bacterium]|nr:hypothetical protein [Tepidisphaeraceae bacterium]